MYCNYNENGFGINDYRLKSIIDDRCDIRTAYERILSFFDPNRGSNRKTKILDYSNASLWSEKTLRLFDVTQTHNLYSHNKSIFDIIIYEPPKKKLVTTTRYSSRIFKKLIKPNGILVTRTSDFRDHKNPAKLKGGFEVESLIRSSGFYLFDQVIYIYNRNDRTSRRDICELIHSYFMIFKPEI